MYIECWDMEESKERNIHLFLCAEFLSVCEIELILNTTLGHLHAFLSLDAGLQGE